MNVLKLVDNPPEVAFICINDRVPGKTPGYRVDSYWSLNLYTMPGRVAFAEDGRNEEFQAGSVCLMPPGTARQFEFLETGRHFVAHFFTPIKDVVGKPLLTNCGDHGVRLQALFQEACGYGLGRRCDALIWNMLWLLADAVVETQSGSSRWHPALRQAVQFIESRLSMPLTVGDVVLHSQVSHNHLTRLFTAVFDQTIIGYIRTRRMELARQLLVYSDMPIKNVAIEVGIPDLQFFNKTVRSTLGKSPTEYRAGAGLNIASSHEKPVLTQFPIK